MTPRIAKEYEDTLTLIDLAFIRGVMIQEGFKHIYEACGHFILFVKDKQRSGALFLQNLSLVRAAFPCNHLLCSDEGIHE